jgi:hypothetical protein
VLRRCPDDLIALCGKPFFRGAPVFGMRELHHGWYLAGWPGRDTKSFTLAIHSLRTASPLSSSVSSSPIFAKPATRFCSEMPASTNAPSPLMVRISNAKSLSLFSVAVRSGDSGRMQ